MRYHYPAQGQRGAVLLLALMLLSLVMFSTLSLATILVTELRSSRFSDNAVVAHYAAESGSEQALFLLKEARSVDELSVVNPYDQFFHPNSPTHRRLDTFGALDQQRLYDLTKISTTSDDFVAYNIPVNSAAQLDIFDPLQELSNAPTTYVSNLHINWQVDAATGANQSRLELTLLKYINVAGSLQIDPISDNPRKLYLLCGNDSGQCLTTDVSLSPNSFYHVSVRPIDKNLKKVTITTSDDNGQTVGIPSQIFIKTTGHYRDASQEVTVQTPWDNGSSDLFNYVIFSDSSLIKNILNSTVAAFPSLCGVCDTDPSIACSDNTVCGGGTSHCTTQLSTYAGACTLDGASLNEKDTLSDLKQNNYGQCNARCSGYTFCGDGTIQHEGFPPTQPLGTGGKNGVGKGGVGSDATPPTDDGNEECDDGNISNTDACNTNCLLTKCGDGFVNTPNGYGVTELCDEGTCGTPGHTSPNCNGGGVGHCNASCTAVQSGGGGGGGGGCGKKNCPPV